MGWVLFGGSLVDTVDEVVGEVIVAAALSMD